MTTQATGYNNMNNDTVPWLSASMFSGLVNFVANDTVLSVGGFLIALVTLIVAILRYNEDRHLRTVELELKRAQLRKLQKEEQA
jgi:hypothetical protein